MKLIHELSGKEINRGDTIKEFHGSTWFVQDFERPMGTNHGKVYLSTRKNCKIDKWICMVPSVIDLKFMA